MSATHIPFTRVLDGHSDVRYLHVYPLQRISNHLTNPLSSELINMQKKKKNIFNFNSIVTSESWESFIKLVLHPYSIHFLTRFISLQKARIKPAEESRVSEAYNDQSFFSLGTPYVSTAKIARL